MEGDVDFLLLARGYLDQLAGVIFSARENCQGGAVLVAAFTDPVMQLKANASTYNYGLINNLVNIMLSFLEAVDEVDETVIAIVEAHHKALSAIVSNEMSGDGGDYGAQMEEELKGACKRYFASKRPR